MKTNPHVHTLHMRVVVSVLQNYSVVIDAEQVSDAELGGRYDNRSHVAYVVHYELALTSRIENLADCGFHAIACLEAPLCAARVVDDTEADLYSIQVVIEQVVSQLIITCTLSLCCFEQESTILYTLHTQLGVSHKIVDVAIELILSLAHWTSVLEATSQELSITLYREHELLSNHVAGNSDALAENVHESLHVNESASISA